MKELRLTQNKYLPDERSREQLWELIDSMEKTEIQLIGIIKAIKKNTDPKIGGFIERLVRERNQFEQLHTKLLFDVAPGIKENKRLKELTKHFK